MLNDIFALVLDTTWIDWFLISSFGLIGTLIAGRCGFFEWLDNIGSKKVAKTVAQNTFEVVNPIIDDLKFSIIRYQNFYENFSFDKPSINIIPYVDELLTVLELPLYSNKDNIYSELQNFLNHQELAKLRLYLHRSSELILWLKLAKKVMTTPLEDARFLEYYRELAIPHKKQRSAATDLITVDPVVEYRKYMECFYIPKIKKLKKTAEELIQILLSKHTS